MGTMRIPKGRLVVDADVACSAGKREIEPTQSCFQFLTELLDSKAITVFNPKLFQEWIDHASPFGNHALAELRSRGRISMLESNDLTEVLTLIRSELKESEGRRRLEKDSHVMDAALFTDRIIISNNNKERKLLRKLKEKLAFANQLEWYLTLELYMN